MQEGDGTRGDALQSISLSCQPVMSVSAHVTLNRQARNSRNAKEMAAGGQGNCQPLFVNECSGCGVSDNIASASLAI